MAETERAAAERRETEAEWMSRNFTEKVHGIANRLRRLADEVEREGRVRQTHSTVGLYPRHASAAQSVMHTLAWGVANLHADSLVIDAARADQAEAAQDAPEDPT